MWFLYVICPVNNISCPCMFHSLPPTGFGPRLVVNQDNLDLLPETVARGQERPLKVTLLPGHRGLDTDMGLLVAGVQQPSQWFLSNPGLEGEIHAFTTADHTHPLV
ncbi:hypothetical protein OYC64_006218 [Pagothenia borchgrevinki]|uniref:Uncharacterized protein n=1 Tax=Pagothenia borchgrevinki TaxID=8213 RepID=A0ABD2GIK4_PAGBO